MPLVKIPKKEAQKRYEKGQPVIFCASKMRPDGYFFTGIAMQKHEIESNPWHGEDTTFEQLINSYSYYNCNKETGLGITYYITEKQAESAK